MCRILSRLLGARFERPDEASWWRLHLLWLILPNRRDSGLVSVTRNAVLGRATLREQAAGDGNRRLRLGAYAQADMTISIPDELRRRASAIGAPDGFIDAHALPAARIIPSDDASEIGCSRLGGIPDLPVATSWPRWDARAHDAVTIASYRSTGSQFALEEVARLEAGPERPSEPLAFLAQIDLSELAAHDHGLPLPEQGHLYFFADTEILPRGPDPSNAGAGRILYAPEGAVLSPTEQPGDLAARARFNSRAAHMDGVLTLPSYRHLDIEYSVDTYEEYDRIQGDLAGNAGLMNQVGGHPQEIQDDMQWECEFVSQGGSLVTTPVLSQRRRDELAAEGSDWRLVLQLGSDDRWMWGNGGCLYWWMREQDIQAGRWHAAWLLFQCS